MSNKISEVLYSRFVMFALLENEITTKNLQIALTGYGFDYSLRTIQRSLKELKASGLPIESSRCQKKSVGGTELLWKWKDTANPTDLLIQAKSTLIIQSIASCKHCKNTGSLVLDNTKEVLEQRCKDCGHIEHIGEAA
ncbi:hypothetical protein [Agitococcus lubricus]|uniref:Uncharacterized protein n=1 Tax=Agitococcus lubricus TaxID=1077255 RepID=A0A2T5ITB8_9GAMM|nr:hypothetical protein [Agitococcus lubricus]PTQ87105.1 hypothetical protein C8N29_12427 [Agitococcus lubricus]